MSGAASHESALDVFRRRGHTPNNWGGHADFDFGFFRDMGMRTRLTEDPRNLLEQSNAFFQFEKGFDFLVGQGAIEECDLII